MSFAAVLLASRHGIQGDSFGASPQATAPPKCCACQHKRHLCRTCQREASPRKRARHRSRAPKCCACQHKRHLRRACQREASPFKKYFLRPPSGLCFDLRKGVKPPPLLKPPLNSDLRKPPFSILHCSSKPPLLKPPLQNSQRSCPTSQCMFRRLS